MSNDPTGGMGNISKKTKDRVDEMLKDDELKLLRDTEVDLESLRPQVSDDESFNKLIEAVQAATGQNENIAQLRERIESLGEGVVKVGKEVFDIIKAM
jgi:hypothetical protein